MRDLYAGELSIHSDSVDKELRRIVRLVSHDGNMLACALIVREGAYHLSPNTITFLRSVCSYRLKSGRVQWISHHTNTYMSRATSTATFSEPERDLQVIYVGIHLRHSNPVKISRAIEFHTPATLFCSISSYIWRYHIAVRISNRTEINTRDRHLLILLPIRIHRRIPLKVKHVRKRLLSFTKRFKLYRGSPIAISTLTTDGSHPDVVGVQPRNEARDESLIACDLNREELTLVYSLKLGIVYLFRRGLDLPSGGGSHSVPSDLRSGLTGSNLHIDSFDALRYLLYPYVVKPECITIWSTLI